MNFEKIPILKNICFGSFHSARSLSEMKTAGLFDNKSINKSTTVECGLIKTCETHIKRENNFFDL